MNDDGGDDGCGADSVAAGFSPPFSATKSRFWQRSRPGRAFRRGALTCGSNSLHIAAISPIEVRFFFGWGRRNNEEKKEKRDKKSKQHNTCKKRSYHTLR